MKKLATLLVCGFLSLGSACAAMDSDKTAKDNMGNSAAMDGGMAKDGMKNDNMAKDGMAKDDMKHDDMAKDGMMQDGMMQDGMAKNEMDNKKDNKMM